MNGQGNGQRPADPALDYPGLTETGQILDSSQVAVDPAQLVAAGEADLSLWYDGVFLNAVDWKSDRIVRAWMAFSGKAGISASLENQGKGDKGPIPESLYTVDPQDTLSRQKADGTWDWIKWTAKSPAWGLYHTPLRPLRGLEEVYGRKGFFVHGGAVPGSAGCIDLVEGNRDFHNWFAAHGTRLRVSVHYVPLAEQIPRTHGTPANCPNNPGLYCTQNTNCEFNRHYSGDSLGRYRREREAELKRLAMVREGSEALPL